MSSMALCFYLFEYKKISRVNKHEVNQPKGKRQQCNYIFLKRVLCTFACTCTRPACIFIQAFPPPLSGSIPEIFLPKTVPKTANQLFNCCLKKWRHRRVGDSRIVSKIFTKTQKTFAFLAGLRNIFVLKTLRESKKTIAV